MTRFERDFYLQKTNEPTLLRERASGDWYYLFVYLNWKKEEEEDARWHEINVIRLNLTIGADKFCRFVIFVLFLNELSDSWQSHFIFFEFHFTSNIKCSGTPIKRWWWTKRNDVFFFLYIE